jgi:hypothetical protein
MNRSIILYMDQLEEGIIGKVGSHIGRNWGKYALGGAAIAAGGIAGAKGALGTTVQGGVNAARGAVNTGLAKVAGTGTVGKNVADTVRTGAGYAKQGVNAGIDYAKKGFVKGVRKYAPDTYAKARLNVAGMGSGGTL